MPKKRTFKRMIGEDFYIERVSVDTLRLSQKMNKKSAKIIILIDEIDTVVRSLLKIKKLAQDEAKEQYQLEKLKAWNASVSNG